MGDAETLASVNALSSQVRPRDPPAAVAEGARIADRYRVVALLGRGGYGEVYRVADELDGGRPLALKLYRVGAAPPEALDALRREFSLLASLHHPHLARVHDFGQVGELAFFTQELVEGVPAHQAGLDLGSERLVRLVAQLARALDYLHGRDVLHGDIKPSNVLIDVEREHLTLLDFGIARTFGRVGEQVAGTFGYLAPELLLGGSVDGRADLYAVGALLYRLASGRVPFHGTPSEIVTAQLEGPPPPLPASMPPALARIVERLLALDPAARFASAAELVQEMSRATGIAIPSDTLLTSFVLGARSVGLDPERARLVELLEARARPILVAGEPGTGKSRLLREVRQRMQLDGAEWVALAVRRAGEGPSAMADLARAVLTPAVAGQIGQDDRLELARSVPELRRPGERLGVAIDPERARHRRLEALARAIALRFTRSRAVIAIEDVHWMRGSELAAVVELAGALASSAPCALVLSARPSAAVDEALAALEPDRVVCRSLGPDESLALVRATFGTSEVIAGTELEAALARGPRSALSLQEILRNAIERGAIRRRGGRWERTAEIEAPALEQVLRERLSALSPAAADVALALAVLRRPSPAGDLAKVSGRTTREAAEPVGELLRQGIAEQVRDALGTPLYVMADRYVEPMRAAASPTALASARAAAAQHLERVAGGDWLVWAEAATHHERAGQRERAHAALRRGADAAREAGRPDAALELVEREIASRAGEAVVELWLQVFDLATQAGFGERAERALAVLREAARAPAESAQVELREVRAAVARGDAAAGRARAGALRARAEALGLGEVTVELDLLEAELEAGHGKAGTAASLFARAAAGARALGAPGLEARACFGQSHAAFYSGHADRVLEHAQAAVEAARRTADPSITSETARWLGNAQREQGLIVESSRAFEEAVHAARLAGSIEHEAKALNNLALNASRLGDVPAAIESYRRAIRLKERLGAAASADVSRNNLAFLLCAIGELEEGRALLDELVRREGGHAVVVVAQANVAELEARAGELDRAAARLDAADASVVERGLTTLRGHVVGALARVLVMRGCKNDCERVPALVAWLEHNAREAPNERVRFLTVQAFHFDLRGEPERALAAATEAAREDAHADYLFGCFGSRMEAHWARALMLARAGRAREALEAASHAELVLRLIAASLPDAPSRQRMLDASPLHRAVASRALATRPGWAWPSAGK